MAVPRIAGSGLGRALYHGLTRPAVIRYFLRRTWGSDAIDEQLWAYDVLLPYFELPQPFIADFDAFFATG